MAHEDPVDRLAEFDTLLREELSAEPSSGFLPRVREQIRTEPTSAPWPWRFAPLTAAAMLVVAIGVFTLSRVNNPNPASSPRTSDLGARTADNGSRTSAPRTTDPPTREALRRASNGPAYARSATAGEQRTRLRATRYGGQATDPPAHEVIVDVRQREALFSFVRMVNRGQLTETAFKDTKQPPLLIEEEVTTIDVIPVAVSPLAVGGVLQGESERK